MTNRPLRPLHAILIVGGIVVGIPVVSLGIYLVMDADRLAETSGQVRWSAKDIDAAKAQSAEVRALLEAYRAVHGRYPNTLAPLVPEFAERIAPPTAGVGEWIYNALNEGAAYELGFPANSNHTIVIWWASATNEWVKTD